MNNELHYDRPKSYILEHPQSGNSSNNVSISIKNVSSTSLQETSSLVRVPKNSATLFNTSQELSNLNEINTSTEKRSTSPSYFLFSTKKQPHQQKNNINNKSKTFLASSTSSSSASSPLSPFSPFDSTSNQPVKQSPVHSQLAKPQLKPRPPTYLPLFGHVQLITSSPLQSINERTQSSLFKSDQTTTTDECRNRIVPTNFNLDPIMTTSDLSDDVFHASKKKTKSNATINSNTGENQFSSIEDLNRGDLSELLLIGTKKRKNPYGFMSQTEIRTTGKHLPIDDNSDIDTTSLLIPLVSEQALGVLDSPASLKLRRSYAFTDLPTMGDFDTPLTFRKQKNNPKNTNNTKIINNNNNTIETCLDDSNHITSYIEEKKVVVSGIKVRAAKISKLVQILMDSFNSNGQVLPGTDFPRVFILMHKWFMESITLTEILFDLYNLYNQYQEYYTQQSDKNYYANQQLKICHAFNFWLNMFPFHFAVDSALMDSVKRFINLIVMKKQRDHLKLIDITKIESYDWMRKLTMCHPLRSKQKITLAFNKIEPEVLACQLTYLEWKTLRRIQFADYHTYAIKGSLHDNPPLEKSIQLFNGLSQWIQCMVLSKATPKQRADIIHKFIGVARHLRHLQNFNSLMAVIGGICHSALARLTKTNLHLSLDDQKTLNDFMELLSSNCNYGLYRKTIAEIHDFYIPIIGIHLKDIISLHTAHLDKLENDLINFRKMAQLSVIFQSLTDLQNSLPPVQENRDLIKLLQLSLDMSYSEDEMYELSLAREPRTSISSPGTPTRISPFAEWAKSISTPLDPQTIQKHVNAMVEAVYKNYDHDKDGFISHDEFYEIAQNFPFIDTFTVLDADKDGMISKIEMKAYFLKANYNALKSEFKHEFHETTYFKLTFCTHCDGLLWGLIKQGWKCKDCGISAHRLCKERVVVECRPKQTRANVCLNRGQNLESSSSTLHTTRSISNRSSARKKISFKQKGTQTDTYDDLFMSDESLTSNENYSVEGFNDTRMDQDTATVSTNATMNEPRQAPHTQRPVRRNFKKFTSKIRRKSLPPAASEEHQHMVALIPRGPLICSNSESLETHFFRKDQFYPNPGGKRLVCNKEFEKAILKQQPASSQVNSKTEPVKSVYVNKNLATPESLDHELGLMSLVNLMTTTMDDDSNKTKTTPNTIAPTSNETEILASEINTETSKELMACDKSINNIYSDFNGFHDYIQDENLDDLNAFASSNDEDLNDDILFYNKLKIEGEKRLRLEQENANLKRQITTLKEEMSIIKSHESVVIGDKEKIFEK